MRDSVNRRRIKDQARREAMDRKAARPELLEHNNTSHTIINQQIGLEHQARTLMGVLLTQL